MTTTKRDATPERVKCGQSPKKRSHPMVMSEVSYGAFTVVQFNPRDAGVECDALVACADAVASAYAHAPQPHTYYPTSRDDYPLLSRDTWNAILRAQFQAVEWWRDLSVEDLQMLHTKLPNWAVHACNGGSYAILGYLSLRAMHPRMRDIIPIERALSDCVSIIDIRIPWNPFNRDIVQRWIPLAIADDFYASGVRRTGLLNAICRYTETTEARLQHMSRCIPTTYEAMTYKGCSIATAILLAAIKAPTSVELATRLFDAYDALLEGHDPADNRFSWGMWTAYSLERMLSVHEAHHLAILRRAIASDLRRPDAFFAGIECVSRNRYAATLFQLAPPDLAFDAARAGKIAYLFRVMHRLRGGTDTPPFEI